MHELSLAGSMMSLVEDAARREGLRRVATIRVAIGALSCVMPEALRFCFDSVTRGTVAEGALLEIVEVAGIGRCPSCGRSEPMEEPFGACPTCARPLVVEAGSEMRVLEIEGA